MPSPIDSVRQHFSGSSLDNAQSALLRPARRSSVSNVLSIIRRRPPVERYGPIRRKQIHIHQRPIFSVYPLAYHKHGLVLHPVAPNIKEIFPADLRRPNNPDRKQLSKLLMNPIPPRQGIKHTPSISQLLPIKFQRGRTIRILQPPVRIRNRMRAEFLIDDNDPSLRRRRNSRSRRIVLTQNQTGHQKRKSQRKRKDKNPNQATTSHMRTPSMLVD